MATFKPHYLLFCDGCLIPSGALHTEARGRWRFVLEDIVTGTKSEASDCEPSDHLDRISLLAVTRGLEALEQPSRVTLITTSRYVARGLQYGLVEWREHDYCWEHFGSIQPIRNADLWRRVDVALRFHEVQCRWMSQESPFAGEAADAIASEAPANIMATSGPATPHVTERSPVDDEEFASSPISISFAGSKPLENEVQSGLRIYSLGALKSPASTEKSTISMATNNGEDSSILPERRLLTTRAKRPVRWLWNTILAADAFLVSCLRCLFLLDPSRDHFRRRNY
jgi:ribonuclease HI